MTNNQPPDTSGPTPDTSGPPPDTSGPTPDTSGPTPDTSGQQQPSVLQRKKMGETLLLKFKGFIDTFFAE